jgi:hypothetical protein
VESAKPLAEVVGLLLGAGNCQEPLELSDDEDDDVVPLLSEAFPAAVEEPEALSIVPVRAHTPATAAAATAAVTFAVRADPLRAASTALLFSCLTICSLCRCPTTVGELCESLVKRQ